MYDKKKSYKIWDTSVSQISYLVGKCWFYLSDILRIKQFNSYNEKKKKTKTIGMILYFIMSKTKQKIKTSLCDISIHAWKGCIYILYLPQNWHYFTPLM